MKELIEEIRRAEQLKEIPLVWKLARANAKYFAFATTVLQLLNPAVIHTMYLYDTGRLKVDKRYQSGDK